MFVISVEEEKLNTSNSINPAVGVASTTGCSTFISFLPLPSDQDHAAIIYRKSSAKCHIGPRGTADVEVFGFFILF